MPWNHHCLSTFRIRRLTFAIIFASLQWYRAIKQWLPAQLVGCGSLRDCGGTARGLWIHTLTKHWHLLGSLCRDGVACGIFRSWCSEMPTGCHPLWVRWPTILKPILKKFGLEKGAGDFFSLDSHNGTPKTSSLPCLAVVILSEPLEESRPQTPVKWSMEEAATGGLKKAYTSILIES